MDSNGKALVDHSKALPEKNACRDNQAMLSTAEALQRKLATVLDAGLTQAEIARACNVSKQAVQGWKKTGRIDKKHLAPLASLSGKPLSWWLDYEAASAPRDAAQPPAAFVATAEERRAGYTDTLWPFATISPAEYASLDKEAQAMAEGFVRGLLGESRRTKSAAAPRAA